MAIDFQADAERLAILSGYLQDPSKHEELKKLIAKALREHYARGRRDVGQELRNSADRAAGAERKRLYRLADNVIAQALRIEIGVD